MRPHTNKATILDKRLIIRTTHSEMEEIRKRCREENLTTVTDYVRSRLFKKRLVKRIEVSEEFTLLFRTLDYDLVKIGTNLNQIARRLNSYNTYMLSEEDKLIFREVLETLKRCFQLLEKHLELLND